MNDATQVAQTASTLPDTPDPICEMCTAFDEQNNPGAEDVRHRPFPKMPKEVALPKLAEFVAGAGLIQYEGELKPRKMSMEMFAHLTGWSRRQLYNWMDAEEDWNEQVFAALRRVHSAKRVARVLGGLYLAAAQGTAPQQIEMYLRHFWPDYKAPKEEKEHTFTGLADLYKAHAATQPETVTVETEEGTVVDNPALPG